MQSQNVKDFKCTKKNLPKDIFLHRAMPYVEKYLSINSRLRMSSLEVYISSISAPQML